MKNKAVDARTYTFSKSDAILADTNILLYLHGPAATSSGTFVPVYSGVYSRLTASGAQLYLDVLVLSEFINRYARLEMRRLQPGQYDFKAFRKSADYPAVARSIEAQVKIIMMDCRPLNHPFSEWKHAELLNDFGSGYTDWNDQLLVENCRKHNLALLTNDGDFTDGGISVLTANARLLAACP